MQLIEAVYLLFDFLYSSSLRDYLSGYDCATNNFSGAHVYTSLAFWTIIISGVGCAIYYKLLDPITQKVSKWAMILAGTALVAAAWAYYTVSSAANKGLIGDCMMRSDDGASLIGSVDYLGFGLSNAFIAAVLFFVFSLLGKFWSTNNRYIPF